VSVTVSSDGVTSLMVESASSGTSVKTSLMRDGAAFSLAPADGSLPTSLACANSEAGTSNADAVTSDIIRRLQLR
jgi:hypothetical protein